MTLSEILILAFSLIAGAAAGVVFFGGLWLTVKRVPTSRQPALLMLGSLIGRAAIVLTVFFGVSGGEITRLAACFFGFLLVRFLMVRHLQPESKTV